MNSRRGLLLISLFAVVLQGCASSRPGDQARVVPSGWPVARDLAVMTSSFGESRGGSRHEGIDLSAPAGTQVKSTADGVVNFAGRSGDFGRLVVIDHGDGWQTRYAHLKKIRAKKGKHIVRGTVVGTIGKSGNATGYHLHYEIRRHGRAVDPRPML